VPVREVTDDPPQGQRQQFYDSGCGYDLFILGQSRILINVDDFQLVSSLQDLLTNSVDIQDGEAVT
jgi:hypothetical protein